MGCTIWGLPEGSVLIVTGSSLRAEEKDRPLAYYIREKILELGDAGDAIPPVHVISDFRYLHEPPMGEVPTVSIGGPGVNALTHKWLEELPVAMAVDDDFYIQISEEEGSAPKAAVWGMNHESTQIAVTTFIEHYLGDVVAQCLPRPSSLKP